MPKVSNKLIVIILFLIAISIRLYGLSEHSLFADEITWMAKGKEYFFALKQINLNYFNNGPWLDKSTTWPIALPMSLLSGIMLVFFAPGQSSRSAGILNDITAGRIPPAIIGAIFIPIFYLLISRYVSKKIAIISALLLALDPVSLGLSRWVSQDLMLMVTSFLGLILFFENKPFLSLIVSPFFTSMAILTKPQGGVVVIALLIYLLTVEKGKKKAEFIKFLKWIFMVVILTIVFFPFLWNNPFKMLWYLKTQAETISQTPPIIFLGQITTDPPWYYYLATLPFHLTEVVFVGIMAGVMGIRRVKLSPFLRTSIIYSLLFFIIISWSPQKLGIRYAFPIWPYLFLLAAFGLTKIESIIKQKWQKIYWSVIFIASIIAVVKFYPSYYLYYNQFVSPQQYQKLESIGFCDGIKPAMEYLNPKLHEGIKIMFYDCNFSANYYTGYTLNHVYAVSDQPEYIVLETYSSQKNPLLEPSLKDFGYHLIKEINFKSLLLARIYAK